MLHVHALSVPDFGVSIVVQARGIHLAAACLQIHLHLKERLPPDTETVCVAHLQDLQNRCNA